MNQYPVIGRKLSHGSISIPVLVFGITFAAIIGGLVLVTGIQYTSASRTEAFEKALAIAQAGSDYYRWHLAHNATDYTDGTNQPGPYIHQITAPGTNEQATFSLSITPPASGSSIFTIVSQGWMNSHPDVKRTVKVRYGKPSFAKYAFLHNANMWYGTRDEIHGPIYSNGGIRMDGTHDSTVMSAKETYTCGTETGCDPQQTKPGVWGSGGPQALWSYPVSAIDFNSINIEYSAMKSEAQARGVYLPPSGYYGYRLVFAANGTVTITKVRDTQSVKGWSVEGGCENLYQTIKTELPVGTYSTLTKQMFFAEDTVWVEGVVNGKVTVAAARFPIDLNKINIWVNGNITYLAKDGNHNLGLIAQNDIYFALDIPQDFEINAAMLSQSGKVIRHNYKYQGCGNSPKAVRQSLTIYGSIVSNLKSYWSYGTGHIIGFGNDPTSGFTFRDTIYDPTLYYGPPPFFPTQPDLEVISWEEQ